MERASSKDARKTEHMRADSNRKIEVKFFKE